MLTHTYDLKWLLDRRTGLLTLRLRRFSYARSSGFKLVKSVKREVEFRIDEFTAFCGGYLKHPHSLFPVIGPRVMDAAASITLHRSPRVQAYLSQLVVTTLLAEWADCSTEDSWEMKSAAAFHVYDRVDCALVGRS